MFDFEYELRKNSGPVSEKCHTRNRRMDVTLHSIPVYCNIVKLYHNTCSLSKIDQNTLEKQISANGEDLEAFVSYSMNKRNRWKLFGRNCVSTLEHLQNQNDDFDTILIERQIPDYHGAWLLQHTLYHEFMLEGSKCKSLSRFEYGPSESSQTYKKKTVKGMGQPLTTLYQGQTENKKIEEKGKTPGPSNNGLKGYKSGVVVSYNIFKAPKNFKKVFDKKCDHFCGLGPECRSEREYFVNNEESKFWWIDYEITHVDETNIESCSPTEYELDSNVTFPDSKPRDAVYKIDEHFAEPRYSSRWKKHK